MTWIELYSTTETIVLNYSGGIGPDVSTQIFPFDPMRYAVTMPSHPNVTVYLTFADSNPVDYDFLIPMASFSRVITRADIGDMICRPVWGKTQNNVSALNYKSLSYAPNKWREYMRWRDAYLSGSIPL